MVFRCLRVDIWGSSTSGVDILECGSTRGLSDAPLVLTDDTTASVFIDTEGCDWQIAVIVPLVVALVTLLLLLLVYLEYGWNLELHKPMVKHVVCSTPLTDIHA